MAGTTLTTLREPSRHFCNNKLHLDALVTTDQFALHQFGAVCRDDIFVLRFESVASN